jgi:hypothetical protein
MPRNSRRSSTQLKAPRAVNGADRSSLSLGDDEHRWSMVRRDPTDKREHHRDGIWPR